MREYRHLVTTTDGLKLSVREYLPEGAVPRRNLLFIHGACEHGGRYAELAEAATAAGWRLLIPDHRGHGLSEGIRVHVGRFDEYLDDVRLHCRHFSLVPEHTAIIGHSMGGLVVARLLESNTELAGAACLLSPYLGLQIQVDAFTLFIGRILAWVWPWYRFKSRVRANDLSPDPYYL
ncbi:MAG: ytpA 1, partial [Planctomycetaceae bacterium]|nr:ytpA 1 [Planctomycetaceae bacterium]